MNHATTCPTRRADSSIQTVRAERTINAPIEEVFDLLSDHGAYAAFRVIRRAELIRDGHTERHGVGALRRLCVGPIRFEEEITAFERPARIDYIIRNVNAPLEHEGGTIRLEATQDTTRVVWTSTARVPLRAIGGVAGATASVIGKLAFQSILKDVAKRLEDRSA